MPLASSSALLDRTRLGTAVAVAALSTWVNRGSQVTTADDAVVWFAFSAVSFYLLFTLLTVAAERVRA
ncbi:hypothetical protein [Haloarchaeobius sp. DT45]|uniref:hypothetical protein n=1 Tax=Haloarchaeobius sp. DT45 TaxID=3446116 RepID=UPI003F6B30C0